MIVVRSHMPARHVVPPFGHEVRAKSEHVLTAAVLPPRPRSLHSNAHQSLCRCLHCTTSNGKTRTPRSGVVHQPRIELVPEIANRIRQRFRNGFLLFLALVPPATQSSKDASDLKKSAIATFDARTSYDSYPVHGQVRELDEMFEDGAGRRYLHPPGRPNDREKEIPWLEPPNPVTTGPIGGKDSRDDEPIAEGEVQEVTGTVWPFEQPELAVAALEPTELERPDPEWGTHVGVASGRKFFLREISLPLERRSLKDVEVTREGIDRVRHHVRRFGIHEHNERMLARLEGIIRGHLSFTEFDVRFYTHELRELERYEAAGWPDGVPDSRDERHRLWNNEHTATLEGSDSTLTSLRSTTRTQNDDDR